MIDRLTPAPPIPADRAAPPRFRPPDPPRVVIVGAGLAGLAAAVALAGRGVRLTVLEARPRLGGRASSFPDREAGGLVDNCQHVTMGCCTNLADFCERTGTRHLFRPLPAIRFLAADAPPSIWKATRLPAPLHLAAAFLGSRFLGVSDKIRVARAMAALRSAAPDDPRPFSVWLAAHGQTPRVQRRFWSTVLVSALNEELERIDIGHARQVFVDGFLRNREGHRVEIPTVPLGILYGATLERWLPARDVELRIGTTAASVDCDPEGAVRGVRLRDGSRIDADFIVLAVPFHRVGALLGPELLGRLPALAGLERIEATPITAIHLWFDRKVIPVDHAAFVDLTLHWMFDLGTGSSVEQPGQYVQCVVSASRELASLGNDAVVDRALTDLARFWPEATRERLRHGRVVTEHRATFAPRPGIDPLRPTQRTPLDGLFLAGDWTRTGWPSTMEGAVRSGYLAAEEVLRDLGRPTRFLKPDLATERLAGWLLGGPRRSARQAASTGHVRP
jgi:squalene-associated FAD-dependent desaturase